MRSFKSNMGREEETEKREKGRKRRKEKREQNVLEEDGVEPAELLDSLLDRELAVGLALEVEGKEENLALGGLGRDVRLDIVGVLLLLRKVDNRAAGTRASEPPRRVR